MAFSDVFYIEGVRSPFVKSFDLFEECNSLKLFSTVVEGLLKRLPYQKPGELIHEIIAGIAVPQVSSPNVARDAVLRLGLPHRIPGYTINCACISGLQAIISAAESLSSQKESAMIAGGVECLSDVPIPYSKDAKKFFMKLIKAEHSRDKIHLLKSFKASDWLPKIPEVIEPISGLRLGDHVEVMAQKRRISQKDQDLYALSSHQKAATIESRLFFQKHILPIWPDILGERSVFQDSQILKNPQIESFGLSPKSFDRKFGTITSKNTAPYSDGACAVLLANKNMCDAFDIKPKLKVLDFDFVAVDPRDDILIGPAISIPRLLKRHGLKLSDIFRFEIHEAFAVQVLSCLRAMDDSAFCLEHLSYSKAFGLMDESKLNVHGGSLALGHPFGATGVRLLIQLGQELSGQSGAFGVLAVCGISGMAGSMLVQSL